MSITTERALAKVAAAAFLAEYEKSWQQITSPSTGEATSITNTRPLSKRAEALLSEEKKLRAKRLSQGLGAIALGAGAGTAVGYGVRKALGRRPGLGMAIGAPLGSVGAYLMDSQRKGMAKDLREYVDKGDTKKKKTASLSSINPFAGAALGAGVAMLGQQALAHRTKAPQISKRRQSHGLSTMLAAGAGAAAGYSTPKLLRLLITYPGLKKALKAQGRHKDRLAKIEAQFLKDQKAYARTKANSPSAKLYKGFEKRTEPALKKRHPKTWKKRLEDAKKRAYGKLYRDELANPPKKLRKPEDLRDERRFIEGSEARTELKKIENQLKSSKLNRAMGRLAKHDYATPAVVSGSVATAASMPALSTLKKRQREAEQRIKERAERKKLSAK